MKISCYGSAFNIEKFNFNIEDAVKNFSEFFDEIICTTVPSQDNTWNILKSLEGKYNKFKVIYSDIQTTGNNNWDGQVRTEALRLCSNEIRASIDYDERFVLSNKPHWIRCAEFLTENKKNIDGILIPSLDLWGNEKYIRADKNVGFKFQIHNSNVYKRDCVNFARIDDNLFDISKSDGTEPVDQNNNLCRFFNYVNSEFLKPGNTKHLANFAYSLHYGYVDFQRKYYLAENFWNRIWTDYQKVKEIKLETPDQMKKYPIIEHGLPLI